MFYKVKQNNEIIDALDGLQCVRYFPVPKLIMRCREDDNPEGILSSDVSDIWHVEGWPEFPEVVKDQVAGEVVVVEITKEEYDEIREQLDELDKIDDPEPDKPAEEEPEPSQDPEPEHETIMTAAEMRERIKELTATVDDLKTTNSMLEECLLEMSEIVYA